MLPQSLREEGREERGRGEGGGGRFEREVYMEKMDEQAKGEVEDAHVHTCTCTYTCEGWLSPGGHSSGDRALTAKVSSIPGGCRFFTVL